MGKSKKRIFHKAINDRPEKLTREEAVRRVAQILKKNEPTDSIEAYNLITLFGMSAEEILEEGASYEAILGLRGIVKDL